MHLPWQLLASGHNILLILSLHIILCRVCVYVCMYICTTDITVHITIIIMGDCGASCDEHNAWVDLGII